MLGVSDNGFVSQYWYDAAGERTVKESFDNEGVYVNGALSGARTGTSKFTAYVSPYMVVSQGGNYTKHVYMGSQRITSKVSNSGIFKPENNPVNTTEQQAKLAQQTANIKERFDSLGVKYSGVQQTNGLVSASPAITADSYFYHSDHLGSSSLITNGSGDLVQHIQYVPFGEVFVEERNAKWSTPYKFNGKEQDEETGLCYYGARYYDPRTSVWLSVDPLAEDVPDFTSYHYCSNNPVMRIDPDGRSDGDVQIPYAQKASYTNNVVVNAATFVNNSCASVVNGAVSLANSALSLVQTPPSETVSQLKNEVTNTVQGVKQFINTPLKQHAEGATQALTSVSFWEDFAGAAGTMLLGGALSKTGNASVSTVENANNPVPSRLARVVPANVKGKTLGAPGAVDVFVTAAIDIRGLNASQIAKKLTIPNSSNGFKVFEFDTPSTGLSSPINRSNPGFVGFGRTAGGAREFTIPNQSIPSGTKTKIIR